MAGETEIRRACSKAGIKIVDIAIFLRRKRQPGAAKSYPLECALQNIQRTGIPGRNAGTAHQIGGELNRVIRGSPGGDTFLGRNYVLIEVFARVPASTCLTITAA